MSGYPIGVTDVTYRARHDDVAARSARARDDGFDHYDADVRVDPTTLALPVGCPISYPRPRAGWCATPAPPAAPDAWDAAVRWWRAAPGALIEPWAGAAVATVESVGAFLAAVPSARLLVDTGHVADAGDDPLALLPLAAHVQLRQGAPGHAQLHPDDPVGVVDFRAVLDALERAGYRGLITVEHFDLPERGWGCDDPVGWARELLGRLRRTSGRRR